MSAKGDKLTLELIRRNLVKPLDRGDSISLTTILSNICRHAKTLDRINETRCNEYLCERDERRLTSKETRIEQLVTTQSAALEKFLGGKVTVEFQGDPRGMPFKIILEQDNEPEKFIYPII